MQGLITYLVQGATKIPDLLPLLFTPELNLPGMRPLIFFFFQVSVSRVSSSKVHRSPMKLTNQCRSRTNVHLHAQQDRHVKMSFPLKIYHMAIPGSRYQPPLELASPNSKTNGQKLYTRQRLNPNPLLKQTEHSLHKSMQQQCTKLLLPNSAPINAFRSYRLRHRDHQTPKCREYACHQGLT